jgi:hypothetical protein
MVRETGSGCTTQKRRRPPRCLARRLRIVLLKKMTYPITSYTWEISKSLLQVDAERIRVAVGETPVPGLLLDERSGDEDGR